MYVGPNLSSCLLLCRWCLAFGRKIIQSEEDFPDSVWINKRLSELVNSEQDILCCEQLSGNLRIICLALIRDCDDALTNTGNINSRKLHQHPAFQLVLADGGNGATGGRGNAVFGTCLATGEKSRWERYDVLGEIKPECMPDWAKEALAKIKEQQKEKKEKNREER